MSDIDKISQEVAAGRARLATTLDDLTDTVNPQKLAHDVTQSAQKIGGDLVNMAWGSLREQPVGGLLVTIGLGLLASGAQRGSVKRTTPQPTHAVDPEVAMMGFEERVAAADAEMRAEMSGEMEPAPNASALRSALNSGLDQLPPKARARITQARKAAIEAQERVEVKAKKATRASKGFVQEQPLAAGALALGFGALFATLLPATRREDALLGARRDALMAEARQALNDEMRKAKLKAETIIKQQSDTAGGQLGI
ncbi:DUF3618 domain-containing protein [uncultured Sulfitobacter sp.]|uniref:DUF3618 domain-containing protein n=1 Tax=uncultured Sulfitobacter sp. TaxID=191468 RepID=UPI0026166830|nr:DUF3618 domain-containing protein [uncultured Sulfitobacter sp.]